MNEPESEVPRAKFNQSKEGVDEKGSLVQLIKPKADEYINAEETQNEEEAMEELVHKK